VLETLPWLPDVISHKALGGPFSCARKPSRWSWPSIAVERQWDITGLTR
jgi:hypothetical protein